jgi:hypothetical protein
MWFKKADLCALGGWAMQRVTVGSGDLHHGGGRIYVLFRAVKSLWAQSVRAGGDVRASDHEKNLPFRRQVEAKRCKNP